MRCLNDGASVLVTGACGHVGHEVCRLLRELGNSVLPVDVDGDAPGNFLTCDLTRQDQVARLFQSGQIRAVIHLAAILPGAFRADPLGGADVNMTGSLHLMRQAVNNQVRRFVFGSSMSVYGSCRACEPLNEDARAMPDEPYGGSKRAIELVGETLANVGVIEFVSLRMARVVGPGIKKTTSPWRSQIFESPSEQKRICISFAPDVLLSLVHVEDVARMLATLVGAAEMRSRAFNSPAEVWEARQLKEVIQNSEGVSVELADNGSYGGPICDGSRFAREFGFQIRGLKERL
jgi:UDP-glucose 4-epimerase